MLFLPPAPERVDLTCEGVPDTTLLLSWTEPAVTGCEGEESLAVVNYEVDVDNLKTGDDETETLLQLTYTVPGRGMEYWCV